MPGCSSQIGNPNSGAYAFGAAEIRIGSLAEANKLTPAHSIGVLSDTTFSFTREFVDLRGGSGNPVLARGASGTDAKITGTFSEFSHRNLNISAGGGLPAGPTKTFATTANASATAGDVSLTIASAGTGANAVVAGDILSIYPMVSPENVQLVRVDSIAGNNVTLDPGTPLLYDVSTLDVITVLNVVNSQTCGDSYLTVQIVAESVDGSAPRVLNGWYGTVTSGLEYSQNNQSFAEGSLEISLYPTPRNLWQPGGVMKHLNNILPANPTFFMPVAK